MSSHIPGKPADGILLHVAVTAMELNALVSDAVCHFRNPCLRHADLLRDVYAVDMFLYEAVDKCSPQFDLSCHLYDLERVVLERTDGLFENDALLTIFYGHVKHGLGHRL